MLRIPSQSEDFHSNNRGNIVHRYHQYISDVYDKLDLQMDYVLETIEIDYNYI